MLMAEASRSNSYKRQRYWYPLSVATYDVEEVLAAVDSLCSFRTTMWEKASRFEQQFAELHGVDEAVMVNSGSSADLLIAFALTNPATNLLQRGDEILVPSVTWPTQIWSAMMAGLAVRLVDADPATLNMDFDDLEAKIGPQTKAVSLVHLMGNPCDMDRVLDLCRRYRLLLIEDCCEALGAKFDGKAVGTFGLAGSYSFFFSHHITTMEGGAIVCGDRSLSDMFRLLRAHGWARNTKYTDAIGADDLDPRYMFLNWGFNLRPTELQAGFGLEQLKRVGSYLAQRIENANYFLRQLRSHGDLIQSMEIHPKAECSWFALPLLLTPTCPFSKRALLEYLEREGVETRPIVTGNIARQPVCKMFPELQELNLPGADAIHDRGFYVGLHPFPAKEQLDRLVQTFDTFLRRYC
jgi:dTDP-4-amino-4,6-dideoxygalactose transaminase